MISKKRQNELVAKLESSQKNGLLEMTKEEFDWLRIVPVLSFPSPPQPQTAEEFLTGSKDLLEERAKQYDSLEGERSMGKTVKAFNAITGRELVEAEGWLLLQLLKDVRQWTTPDSYHADSAEDAIAYAALKAEALVEAEAIKF